MWTVSRDTVFRVLDVIVVNYAFDTHYNCDRVGVTSGVGNVESLVDKYLVHL